MQVVGTSLDIPLWVAKLVLDELDVRAGTLLLGIEFADVSSERAEEGAERIGRCPLWVRSDEP